jgi:hypothetical protein
MSARLTYPSYGGWNYEETEPLLKAVLSQPTFFAQSRRGHKTRSRLESAGTFATEMGDVTMRYAVAIPMGILGAFVARQQRSRSSTSCPELSACQDRPISRLDSR